MPHEKLKSVDKEYDCISTESRSPYANLIRIQTFIVFAMWYQALEWRSVSRNAIGRDPVR